MERWQPVVSSSLVHPGSVVVYECITKPSALHASCEGGWDWGIAEVVKAVSERTLEVNLWVPFYDQEQQEADEQTRTTLLAKQQELMNARRQQQTSMAEGASQLDAVSSDLKARKDKAQADLDAAMPALVAAKEALSLIKVEHLRELRAYTTPPPTVSHVLQAVNMIVHGEKVAEWSKIRALIRKESFIPTVRSFDSASLSQEICRSVRQQFLADPQFTYENARRGSVAAGPLHSWVFAQVQYAELLHPLRQLESALANLQNSKEVVQLHEMVDRCIAKIHEIDEETEKNANALKELDAKPRSVWRPACSTAGIGAESADGGATNAAGTTKGQVLLCSCVLLTYVTSNVAAVEEINLTFSELSCLLTERSVHQLLRVPEPAKQALPTPLQPPQENAGTNTLPTANHAESENKPETIPHPILLPCDAANRQQEQQQQQQQQDPSLKPFDGTPRPVWVQPKERKQSVASSRSAASLPAPKDDDGEPEVKKVRAKLPVLTPRPPPSISPTNTSTRVVEKRRSHTLPPLPFDSDAPKGNRTLHRPTI